MGHESDFVAVDHITITVKDMDAVKHFYERIGLRVSTDVTVEGESTAGGFALQDGRLVELAASDADGKLFDSAHKTRRMVVFERIGGTMLTLITWPGDEDTLAGANAIRLDRLGFTHLAFDVRDLGAFVSRMQALGIEAVAPGFFQDPEGNIIQVQEAGHAELIRSMYHDRYGNNA